MLVTAANAPEGNETDLRLEQPEHKAPILVTAESEPEGNARDCKELQPLNIPLRDVRDALEKDPAGRLIACRDAHRLNALVALVMADKEPEGK